MRDEVLRLQREADRARRVEQLVAAAVETVFPFERQLVEQLLRQRLIGTADLDDGFELSAPATTAAGPNLTTMSPSVRHTNPTAPVGDVIALAPASKPRATTLEIVRVRFRGTERRGGVTGQHALRLLIESGTHSGMTKRWPLDWPRTNRSAERLDHLAAALGLDEIRNPLRDTWDKTAQAEVVTNPDGSVHVRRIFKP